MSRDQWADWLGPAADALTDDQLARLADAAQALDPRWPDGDPDHAEDRTAALSAAMQVVVGDSTLEEIGEAFRRAQTAAREQQAALVGALLASSTGARSGPGSESDLIERSGASRMTVRKALGR